MPLVYIGYNELRAEIPLFLLPVALIIPSLHLCHVSNWYPFGIFAWD